MIPKIIHYCWFGGNPLPPLALECIASWKKFLPDYEIKEWNEKNFDVNITPYTAEAYRQKKYAFVSDYARFWILEKHGGIYFDTDVEVIRPLDDIIAAGNFMGFEYDPDGENSPSRYAPRYCFSVSLGLGFGVEAGHPFMRKMLTKYENMEFITPPTGKDFAYLKIGEGCSNRCTYCAIPYIRGPLKSRTMEDILEEARAEAERICDVDKGLISGVNAGLRKALEEMKRD